MKYFNALISVAVTLAVVAAFYALYLHQEVTGGKFESNILPPFNVGEKLLYKVDLVNSTGTYYLHTLNLSVMGMGEVNGCDCFILKGEYVNINITMHSYVTVSNLTLIKTAMETPSTSLIILYDYEKGKCSISVTANGTSSQQEADIKPGIQDPLSIIYYIRSLPLDEDYWCNVNQLSSRGVVTLKASVGGKVYVETALEKLLCYKVLLEFEGSSTTLLVSTSDSRVPVLVEIPVSKGAYQRWTLIEYSPPIKIA